MVIWHRVKDLKKIWLLWVRLCLVYIEIVDWPILVKIQNNRWKDSAFLFYMSQSHYKENLVKIWKWPLFFQLYYDLKCLYWKKKVINCHLFSYDVIRINQHIDKLVMLESIFIWLIERKYVYSAVTVILKMLFCIITWLGLDPMYTTVSTIYQCGCSQDIAAAKTMRTINWSRDTKLRQKNGD